MYSPVQKVLEYCEVLTSAELAVLELGIYNKRLKRVSENPDQVRQEFAEHDQENPDDFLSLLLQ